MTAAKTLNCFPPLPRVLTFSCSCKALTWPRRASTSGEPGATGWSFRASLRLKTSLESSVIWGERGGPPVTLSLGPGRWTSPAPWEEAGEGRSHPRGQQTPARGSLARELRMVFILVNGWGRNVKRKMVFHDTGKSNQNHVSELVHKISLVRCQAHSRHVRAENMDSGSFQKFADPVTAPLVDSGKGRLTKQAAQSYLAWWGWIRQPWVWIPPYPFLAGDLGKTT